MKLNIGFSPCPNDTFTLYQLLHERQLGDFNFEHRVADVEELNREAMNAKYEITKMSFKAFYYVCDRYDLLSSGAALGYGNGPLFISRGDLGAKELSELRVAIPGEHTTATFLLNFAYPQVTHTEEMIFSEIESAILEGVVDAGVIIHETRFLYEERGLCCEMDLGAFWEEKTGLPIPLGGFAVRKDLAEETKRQIRDALQASIKWGWEHYELTMPFVKAHSQELDDDIIRKHIHMFVNDFSEDLGGLGRKAVNHLFQVMNEREQNQKTPTII